MGSQEKKVCDFDKQTISIKEYMSKAFSNKDEAKAAKKNAVELRNKICNQDIDSNLIGR